MFTESDLILVVDDEQSGCDELSPLFGRLGCRTRMVASTEEALSILADEMVAVTMLPNGLLRMDGLEILAKIKKISPDTEVIITNHNSLSDTGSETIREKAYDYLRNVITSYSIHYTKLYDVGHGHHFFGKGPVS